MKIEIINELNEEQKIEIEELEKICNEKDSLENKAFLSNEINFNKNIPCFFLGYEGPKLISFLTTFIPQINEVEIMGFTHPSYRGKGYFSNLFKRASVVLKKTCASKVFLVMEPRSESGKIVLKTFKGAKLERSEYRMLHKNNKVISENGDLKFTLLRDENKEVYGKLCESIFEMDMGDSKNFIENAINADDRLGYIAYYNKVPIGVFNLNYQEDTAFIYGVGIEPSYQGKGYGKQLLWDILNESYKKAKNIILDVDSSNPKAYNLYIQNGFEIVFQVDYFAYYL